jgi:NAD(P)-dependent dehydrogenase (short-subunit alcohol dehydrogenase family)
MVEQQAPSSPEARAVAVVTGAASGVGLAVARRLCGAGARVVFLDIDAAAGENAAAEAGGLFQYCDVGKRADWARVRDLVMNRFGPPTLLSFNAGVMTRPSSSPLSDNPFDWIEKGGYAKVFDVNLHGVAYGLEAMLPVMRDAGSIVATVSIAGLTPTPFDPFYCASKHAAIGLLRSVASLLKRRNIRVNAFCPGPIDTPIMPREFVPHTRDAMKAADAADSIVSILQQERTGEVWVRVTADRPAVIFELPRTIN